MTPSYPGTVKYGYAYDITGKVIRIDQAQKGIYACISCGNKLIPVINVTKKQKHFRHNNSDLDHTCCPETYLHKLAKQVFYESYLDCLTTGSPFFATVLAAKKCIACDRGPCSIVSEEAQTVDLTEHFTEISPPDSCFDGQFKPDILIRTPKGEALWVEIVVTHWSDPSKAASGTRIIEILIESEKAVDSFRDHRLDPKTTTLHNFRKKTVVGNFESECVVDISAAALYPNGNILFTYAKMIDHRSQGHLTVPGSLCVHVEEWDKHKKPTIEPLLMQLYKERHKGTFCLMCIHYCWDNYSGKPFCLYKEDYIYDTPHTACSHYAPLDRLPDYCGLDAVFRAKWRSYEFSCITKNLQRKAPEPCPPTPNDQHSTGIETSNCRKCGREVAYDSEEYWFFNKGTGECECNSCLRGKE